MSYGEWWQAQQLQETKPLAGPPTAYVKSTTCWPYGHGVTAVQGSPDGNRDGAAFVLDGTEHRSVAPHVPRERYVPSGTPGRSGNGWSEAGLLRRAGSAAALMGGHTEGHI